LHHIDFPSDDEFDVSVSLVIVRRQSKKLSVPDGYVRFVNKDTSFDFLEYGSDGFFVLPLRVVRFKLPSGEYEALVTNLPVDDFSPDELKNLYFRRWGIETSFRHLKYTIGLSKFHAKKASFVTQEIWARLISYNFTTAVMDCVRIPVSKRQMRQQHHGIRGQIELSVRSQALGKAAVHCRYPLDRVISPVFIFDARAV